MTRMAPRFSVRLLKCRGEPVIVCHMSWNSFFLSPSGCGPVRALAVLTLIVLASLTGCRQQEAGEAAFHQGVRQLEQKRYAQSIRSFQKALAENTSNKAVIYNSLGIAYRAIGQRENAEQAFDCSLRLNTSLVEPAYNMGVLLAEADNLDKAIWYFEKAAALDPRQTRALEYLGTLYVRAGRWDEARRTYMAALTRAPRAPRLLTAQAMVELNAGNVDKAVYLLQETLEHDAHYPPAIYNLALVNHYWLANTAQAIAFYKDFARVSPDVLYTDRARQALKDLKDVPLTAKLENSLPLADTAATGRTPISTAWVPPATRTGILASASGPLLLGAPPPPTLAPTATGADIKPLSFDTLFKLAVTHERDGRRDAAVNNYLRAAAWAETHKKTENQTTALAAAESACGDDPCAHFALGLYLVARRRPADALDHLRQAAFALPNWYDAQMAMADVAMARGEYDAAVISLKQADQCRADHPDALWRLARLYDQSLSMTDSALQGYLQFLRRFPGDPRAAEARARIQSLRAPASRPDTTPAPAASRAPKPSKKRGWFP